MMFEGKGEIAPSKVQVSLTTSDALILSSEAKRRAEFRGYAAGGEWSRGLKGGREYPGIGFLRPEERSIFVGLLGEFAVQDWLNRRLKKDVAEVDLKCRATGDGGWDFLIRGIKFQVKTRQRADAPSLIRRATDRCAIVPIRADVYVFAEFLVPWTVCLLGWLKGKYVRRLPTVPARCAGHSNSEIPDAMLEPMSGLAAELRRRKGWRSWP